MKRYYLFSELLIDYRKYYKLSQLDFANKLQVDLRTIQRWEKDLTLISADKEEDFVLETLIPYQLVRNLNAKVPIPTFYDFKHRIGVQRKSISFKNSFLQKTCRYFIF